MAALDEGGNAQQVVPNAGDQLLVEPAGEQVPGGRVPGRELGSRPGPVQGDLAQVADARGQLQVYQVEQREFAIVAPWVSVACWVMSRSVWLPRMPSST